MFKQMGFFYFAQSSRQQRNNAGKSTVQSEHQLRAAVSVAQQQGRFDLNKDKPGKVTEGCTGRLSIYPFPSHLVGTFSFEVLVSGAPEVVYEVVLLHGLNGPLAA